MNERSAGGAFDADHVSFALLNVWLALVRWPVASIPPTVKRLPLPSSTTLGYQRAVAMSGFRTYELVAGLKTYVFCVPAFALFVAGLGYAEFPPATSSSPS